MSGNLPCAGENKAVLGRTWIRCHWFSTFFQWSLPVITGKVELVVEDGDVVARITGIVPVVGDVESGVARITGIVELVEDGVDDVAWITGIVAFSAIDVVKVFESFFFSFRSRSSWSFTFWSTLKQYLFCARTSCHCWLVISKVLWRKVLAFFCSVSLTEGDTSIGMM